MRANTLRPLAWIWASTRSIVAFGPELLWTLVSPSMLPGELDTHINQLREKIPIDDELAPFCVVVGCWFGSYSFI
jgi:hypothetical protein